MIDALVKFGVKDQNVVLSTMAKINKAKKELVKKTNLSFGGGGGSFGGIRQEINARKQVTQMERESAARSGREKLAEMKKEQFANNTLVKGASMAGNALKDVARSAATLDPVAFIQGTLNAAGKAASGIPFLGGAAQGGFELAGVAVGAAAGAVGSAKQSTASALEIEKRNAQNNLYGGALSFGASEAKAKAKIERDNAKKIAAAEAKDARANAVYGVQRFARGEYAGGGAVSTTASDLRAELLAKASKTDTTDRSTGWTPADKTAFIQSVSGQFGRIQTPLANVLNEFIAKGKNVEQFTQVASGNWNALGTDEGAILQQITNSFSGALPSVKQALQAELVKGFGDKVEKEDPVLAGRRAAAAAWARQGERQDQRVADAAARMGDTLYKLDKNLNDVQIKLINGANKLAEAVNKAVAIIGP